MELCDVTAAIRPGVYILWSNNRVVFVGHAKNPLLRIYAHSNHRRGDATPAWMPIRPLAFDRVDIRNCRVEELASLWEATCKDLGWAPPQATQTKFVCVRRA